MRIENLILDQEYSRNFYTSGELLVPFLTETCAPGADLSEVLLDLDLTEDLLELFGVAVEASLVAT